MTRRLVLAAAGVLGAAVGWWWAGRAPVGWRQAGEADEYVSARWP